MSMATFRSFVTLFGLGIILLITGAIVVAAISSGLGNSIGWIFIGGGTLSLAVGLVSLIAMNRGTNGRL